jgi:deoxyribose-phosphate aldolase
MNILYDELFQKLNICPTEKKCLCLGEHEYCISCRTCRSEQSDISAFEINNLHAYIDHTILRADATYLDIKKLCEQANDYDFMSVCIHPSFISFAKNIVNKPLICTVIGFPLGANSTEVKVFEAEHAILQGAKEVDLVINIGKLKGGAYQYVSDEIEAIQKVCSKYNATLKVIIETCLLTTDEVVVASLISKKAGADFVKTSTGFSTRGADVDVVRLIRSVVGKKLGVKASGGVRSREDAIAMIHAGANRIGSSNSVAIVSENMPL